MKWNLVTDVTEYAHSPARFYVCGEHAAWPVMSYLELDDIGLRSLRSGHPGRKKGFFYWL